MKKILAIFLLAIFTLSILQHVSVGFGFNSQTSAGAVKAEQWTPWKPDLTLTSNDIVFSPTSPTEGETVTVRATIHNVGNGWVWSAKVGFYKGSPKGKLIGTGTVWWLRAGGSGYTWVKWIAELGYDICVVADPDNTVSELNENNNVAYRPNPVSPAVPIHDVAVISVTPSPTDVTAGDIVTITVVVENQGDFTENFNVASYYDFVAIETQTVTGLAAGASETLTFTWDTTGVAEGEYTIRGEASVVSGEEDTADNALIDGTVRVVSPLPPQPDLTLSFADITFAPVSPTEGESVTITATVRNIGGADAISVTVGFWLDGDRATGTPIGTDTIASIVAGGTGTASVTWTAVVGTHYVYVVADSDNAIDESDETNNQASKAITVSSPMALKYELFIEIDYMKGHYPTEAVLNYIKTYYYEREISVIFYIDDVVPYDPSVTDAEFWAIEATYNDAIVYDDQAQDGVDADGDGSNYEYRLKEKWVLFGTTVQGKPNVVGYTYVIITRFGDLLAGNYIFIADGTADKWAADNGIEAYGPEAVVLMHEMGHSIGIGKLSRRWWYDWRYGWRYSWVEVYDPDLGSVMSHLSVNNATLYWAWYYSNEYWVTKNVEYYAV